MSQPKHRLVVRFLASEIPNRPAGPNTPAWTILPSGQEREFHFDSAQALCQPQDQYLEGLDPNQATGHCFYSWLQPTPFGQPGLSLRIFWREISYADGSEYIDGAILNESMEAPLGRLRGKLSITKYGVVTSETPEVFTVESATLSDQNGCCFSFGTLKPWLNVHKLSWLVNRFKDRGQVTPAQFWTPVPCPDAQQGDAWQAQWTPYSVTDQSNDWIRRTYWNSSDPRNPPIGALIGESKVCNWYNRQTHSHYREGAEGFRSPWDTAFLAAGTKGDFPQQQDILRSLWEYVKAQVGAESATGQGYIDGRPLHLSLLSGEIFRAGRKYNLNASDRAAPFSAVLQEGRPQIGKSGYLFWECFGREMLSWIEVTAGQFKGAYSQPNGQDYEHSATEPLLAAIILYGDPLAQRQLHHIAEEHCTKQGVKLHSTRSDAGWKLSMLANAYAAFVGHSTFGQDALRYRDVARAIAANCWQSRFDETPYTGMLTAGYEYMDQHAPDGTPLPERQKVGYESTMQLGVSLHMACLWYQLEHEDLWKRFWRSWIDYIFGCLDQPGVIDWSRGGILQRYNLQGPAALDPQNPKSVGERLEETAPANYRTRFVLSAEGWIGPAILEAWLVTGNPRQWDLGKEIYDHQALVSVGHGFHQFNPNVWESWGTFYPSIQAIGFTS